MLLVLNAFALFCCGAVLLIVYFNLLSLPLGLNYVIGTLLSIQFFYNIYLYLDSSRTSNDVGEGPLNKFALPLISGVYMGTNGVLAANLAISAGLKYDTNETLILILGGTTFLFGVFAFYIFAFFIRYAIRSYFGSSC
jgi:hypothetical protein